MRISIGQVNGDTWESYCQKLLRLKYADYQEVPAQFGGDLGIEGFSRTGIVFQCYCPDEDIVGVELYEKQRDKITKDINKLIRNADSISQLGVGVIKEWHFLTPSYNNRMLLSHCRTKEDFVLSKRLDSIDNNFFIYLKTEDDYLPEIRVLVGIGDHLVHPHSTVPDTEELNALLNSNNDIVENIKRKLGRLQLSDEEAELLIRQLVSGYAVGQNELEVLNQRFPQIYQSVIQLKNAKETQLGIRSLSIQDDHGSILKQVLDDYEEKLNSNFSKTLTGALISKLSTEAIADWLGNCPLDFPNSEIN